MKSQNQENKRPSFKRETVRRFNPLTSRKKLLTALTLGIVYFVHGLVFNSWHPFWLIFLLLPILVLFRYQRIRLLMRLSMIGFFISFAVFITIGHYTGVYHPTWLVMFTPLFIGLLAEEHPIHKWMLESCLALSIGMYLLVGYLSGDYELALFSFLIFIIPAIFTGHIYIHLHAMHSMITRIGLIVSFIVFFLWGYFFDAYGIAWIALLAVPIMSVAVHAKGRDTLVPFTVAMSLLIFYILGYYTGAWYIVWTVFLLGPIVSFMQKIW